VPSRYADWALPHRGRGAAWLAHWPVKQAGR
jgi:hypothetical protein